MNRSLLTTGDCVGRIDDAERNGEVAWSLEGTHAASFGVDPHDADTLDVGRHADAVARTRDGGHSWEEEVGEPDQAVAGGAGVSP